MLLARPPLFLTRVATRLSKHAYLTPIATVSSATIISLELLLPLTTCQSAFPPVGPNWKPSDGMESLERAHLRVLSPLPPSPTRFRTITTASLIPTALNPLPAEEASNLTPPISPSFVGTATSRNITVGCQTSSQPSVETLASSLLAN